MKKKSDSLSSERGRVQNYLDIARAIILSVNTSGNVTMINKKGCSVLGYNEEEVLGRNWADNFIPEGFRNEVRTALQELINGRTDYYGEYENFVLTRDREELIISWNNKVLRDDTGNITGILSSGEDITRRRWAEVEALRACHLAALGELAAGIAHEINNPINGIMNYAQIMMNENKSGSHEYEISGRIIKESERIANVIKSLLSFARDSSEGRRSVCIRDIITESLTLLESQIQRNGITLTLDIPEERLTVYAKSHEIQQVILNILSNARYALNKKYDGPHEDKVLEISVARVDSRFVRMSFYDRGTGIPEGIMKKIMNPFYTTKPAGEGTGLGLSISHGIIISHGGRMNIESIENEYSKVVIELPSYMPQYKQSGPVDQFARDKAQANH
jgi:PAS domain S-box-containing protein